jgi:2,4-didehydro-3-deoxy-L-rhamnonate hydrolase
MRLCTVKTTELEPFFGLELNRRVLRVGQAAQLFEFKQDEQEKLASTMAYFQNLPSSEKILRKLLNAISENPKKLARPAEDGQPCFVSSKDVVYLPPITAPGKYLCIGMNYKDHCEEQDCKIPSKPMIFNKFLTSLNAHEQPIPLPLRYDKCVDYEAELGIVIGKRARRVTKKSAMKCVAGYTICNDVSCRTIQSKERQWARAKGFDGSGPFGPCIVTADEIPDPHALNIATRLNGRIMQKSNTSNLIFDIPYLIHFISQLVTLEPGDIISTGTPGGVGVYRNPQVFLKEGDIVEVTIDRLGTLRNPCVKG